MRTRIAWMCGLAAAVAIAGSAAAGGVTTTSTTVTTTSSTTTTTVLGGCVDDQSFESILCQLDALIVMVDGSTDLGRFKQGVLGAVNKARRQVDKASSFRTNRRTALNQLKKAAKSLDSFRHKLDSNNAKRVIPPATRDLLRGLAADIRSDVNALRSSL